MKILGISNSHDSSAAIIIDGIIVAASEEERFDRIKHSKNFPINAIKFCLEKSSLLINEIDEVCVSMDWLVRAKSRFDNIYSSQDIDLCERAVEWARDDINKRINTERIIRQNLGYNGKISFFDHHDCHAAACYFPSKFKEAAILTIDGAGEQAATRIYHAKGNKFFKKIQFDFPNSLGALYSLTAAHLGFKVDCDEGKIMGLAAYGDGSLVKKFNKIIKINKEGEYKIKSEWLDFIDETFSKDFIKEIGILKRKKNEKIEKKHENLAFATQKILEFAVLKLIRLAQKITGSKYLCFGGGVTLNSVVNGKIAKSGLFKDIYIYPAPGDNGTSVGAALYSYYCIGKKKKTFYEENQSPYLGYLESKEEIIKNFKKYKLVYTKPENLEKEAAILLSKNKIIGWFSGRTEFGPRALGNRSILADPRDSSNKDRVNLKIKFREPFRPFAPVVIEEFAEQYFNMLGFKSPYMSLTFKVKKDKKDIIPAVTHIDNTARVQTINKKQNRKFWNLINEFYKITGIPVLLNTSFNKTGDPMVNTSIEAIETFMECGLDALVLEDYLVQKNNQIIINDKGIKIFINNK